MITFIKRLYRWYMPFQRKITRDNIFAIAGQTAFFLVLSSVPLLMFLMTILDRLNIAPDYLNFFLHHLSAAADITTVTDSLSQVYDASVSVSVVSVIATLWSAAKGMHAITNGLNRVHNTFENRNWLVVRIRAMVHTFVFLLIIVGSVGVVFLGSTLNDWIEPYLKNLPEYIVLIYSLRYFIIFLYQVFLFALLYRNIPNLPRSRRKEFGIRCQLPGALFCGVSWHVLLVVISVYVTDFNGFSIYKGLTQLAIVMIFMYFCMICLMLGAEINVIYHKEIDWFTYRLIPKFLRRNKKTKPE